MALSGSVRSTAYDGRYYQFDWTATQSESDNQSIISWTLKALSGSQQEYIEKSLSVSINGIIIYLSIVSKERTTGVISSGEYKVNHDIDGTKKLNVIVQAKVNSSFVTCLGVDTFILTAIPRKSTLSVGNGALGIELNMTVSKKDSSFTHTIVARCGSKSEIICTKSSSTSIKFTPPLEWADQNTTGTSMSVKYTITAYYEDANLGSNEYTQTCSIPSSVKPSVSFTVEDATSIYSTFDGYVQSQSKYTVVINAAGIYGSTIKSYKTIADGKTYTASSFTSAIISGSGSQSITVTVTDSRGRTASATVSELIVLPYSPPKIDSLKIIRCNQDGTKNSSGEYLAAVFNVDITTLDDKNTANYQIKHKKASETSYTTENLTDYEGQYSVENGVFIFSADKASSYDVILTVTDYFGSVEKGNTGSSIKKLWSVFQRKMGVAIGKVAELEGVFEVALQSKFTGGIIHPVIPKGTDLDTIILCNTYAGNAAITSGYLNCPVTTDESFTLEILSAGNEGQLFQRITTCNTTSPREYVRFYCSNSWGGWIRKFGVVLYENSNGSNESITLSEPVTNFEYLEIFYTDNNDQKIGSVKILSSTGSVSLSGIEASSATTTYLRRTKYSIYSGETGLLQPDMNRSGLVKISNATPETVSDDNYIKIYRVIGYEKNYVGI